MISIFKNKCIKTTIYSAIINGVGLSLMSMLVYIIMNNACNQVVSTELCNKNPLMSILQWMWVVSLIIGTVGGGIFGYVMKDYRQKL